MLPWPPGVVGREVQLAGPDESWTVTLTTALPSPHWKEQGGMVGGGPHAQTGWTPTETPASLSRPPVRFWHGSGRQASGRGPALEAIRGNPLCPPLARCSSAPDFVLHWTPCCLN